MGTFPIHECSCNNLYLHIYTLSVYSLHFHVYTIIFLIILILQQTNQYMGHKISIRASPWIYNWLFRGNNPDWFIIPNILFLMKKFLAFTTEKNFGEYLLFVGDFAPKIKFMLLLFIWVFIDILFMLKKLKLLIKKGECLICLFQAKSCF